MTESLIVVILGLLAIAAASTVAPRVGVAAPLLLVLTGIGVSFLPFVPDVEIEPEWILTVVLPPLLYSAAVSMPSMEFRREFTAIRGLSVVLVVLSALALGVFFHLVIPDLSLAWGIALGAIVSPTDAVATSIVKRVGVSGRITAVLEGESLLNDATALVILRSAIAATAASVSVGGVLGDFAFAIAAATAIGFVVGHANVWVRARVSDPAVNTALSFTVPFLAAVPAEEIGASGLVAAVVAGLATGQHAPQRLSARHRLSDAQNWRTVELILEGGVFLVMGLELSSIVDEAEGQVGTAAAVAAAALALTLLIRAAYVAPLLVGLGRRARRGERMKPHAMTMQAQLDERDPEFMAKLVRRSRTRDLEAAVERLNLRIRRSLADIDYFLAAPLGWREGVVVVWAGMRGAVTLAAAQTLPEDTPQRSLLILIAFLVAAGSLILQGGTLPRVVKVVRPAPERIDPEERVRLDALLAPHTTIAARREALLDIRDDGAFSAPVLTAALAELDAEEIGIELKTS
ncbi:sodium:proton antiporter [Solirubrobacter phytolaccae]|uniref:Sodium:proton antiporter n=1 Tax=Solirubrobacter phytolaccae TaxID=1404360 RepID=A0A9X3NA78_9ACTN|nr:sodium:proton antiporter [Solirubrobacter phytolaccae]MDA0180356.1 sodium:proton antiporter [Solirubrobacter phytolaccae]